MIKLPEWIKNKETAPENYTHNNKKIWKSLQFYVQTIWKRIASWKNYPLDYITLYESQGNYTLYHFKNNLLTHTQNISIEQPDWQEYISSHKHSPIYLIVQGQDCEFRTLPTNQIHIWDRLFLFNQIKTNEFGPDDLVAHYQPKQHPERVDIFVSTRSNDTLKQMFKILASLKNPIGGVLSWDIEQNLAMKKRASINSSLRAWIVTVIPVDSNSCTIIIQHTDKILLQRLIFTKNMDDLEKELHSTLRFLQRQGYKEGQAVSILTPKDNRFTTFSNAGLELIQVPEEILEKSIYKPTKPFLIFSPQTLKQARLAHELPKLCIKILIPVSIILLILWASIQIKSFFQDYENKWLTAKYDQLCKKSPKNLAEQVHLSSFFNLYIRRNNQNPFNAINNANKLLKGIVQISEITWNLEEHGSEFRLKFSKKNQKNKKHISNKFEQIFENATLTWDEHDKDTTLLIQQRAEPHND